MNPIRVAAIMEAATVTGPAKNLIRFATMARDPAGASPPCELCVVTFVRSRGSAGSEPAANQFVDAARQAGITVHVIVERFRFDPRVLRKMKDILAQCAPDIVQSHGVKAHFLVCVTNAHRLYRWLAFHHGYTDEDLKMRLYNRLNRWTLPKAPRVITVCQAFAAQLFREGVKPEQLVVLPNSISPAPRHAESEIQDLRRRLGIADEERVVVSIGRLSREKAHINLVRAAAHMRKAKPDLAFRIVLVGDGPERSELMREAASLGVGDRILFTGHQRDVSPLLGLAELFVLPSRSEGSPNVVLEAMAAGVPIVASAVGGVPEMIENEVSALLVPPDDPEALAAAMLRLLRDPGLAAKLVSHAAAVVRDRFSPEAHRQRLLGVYSRMLSADRA